ncbi:hypothetical protein ACN267_03025 [Micromonospora sp. WMMD734]|uniref:hypothetical protein n=1 Tax=Micromonospora sp. WMMD734 TaxID=3404129 RepID=UPI003B939DFC
MAWLNKRDRVDSPAASTRRLIDHLRTGGQLIPIAPPLVTRDDEVAYTDIVVTTFAYYGAEVSWASGYAVQGGPLFTVFGILRGELNNSRARREAERMAAAQWRAEGDIRVVLTNQRLVLFFGSGVEVYWLEHLVSVTPAPDGLSVVLAFTGGVPLAFAGPWAPWLCIMTSKLVHRAAWPPGHNPPAFLSAAPAEQKAVGSTPKARPAIAVAPSSPAEPSPAEQLAERVDRLSAADAAKALSAHPTPLVTEVLDLLGTRKAAAIRSALADLRG